MVRSGSAGFLSLRELGCRAGADGRTPSRVSDLAIFTAWGEAAGPLLGRVTRPVAFDGGRLLVEVADPAWISQIEGLKDRIAWNLAAIAGADRVTEIRFRPARRCAPKAARPAAESLPAQAAAEDPERGREGPPAEFDPDPASIRDDLLRRRFAAVARRYLGRRT